VDWRDLYPLTLDTALMCLPGITLAINTLGADFYQRPLPGPAAMLCPDIFADRCYNTAIQDEFVVYNPFFVTMIIGVSTSIFSVKTFGQHKAVFLRERLSGRSTMAHFLAKSINDLINITRVTMLFCFFFFPLAAPHGSLSIWFGLVWALSFVTYAMGQLIGILADYKMAASFGVVTAIALSITNGLTPPFTTVESSWSVLRVFWDLSHTRVASEAFISLNSGIPTATDLSRMDFTLASIGYVRNRIGFDIGVLIGLGFMWRLFVLIALYRLRKH
jgi:hypothetical protein